MRIPFQVASGHELFVGFADLIRSSSAALNFETQPNLSQRQICLVQQPGEGNTNAPAGLPEQLHDDILLLFRTR